MRKIVSLISLASVILFMSCSNEESMDLATPSVGELKAVITFEGTNLKSAQSTAIPVTNWDNIKSLQLFLYTDNAVSPNHGKVAYSVVIDPASSTETPKEFKWTNVPVGTYTLALVANINSQTQNVATSVDGGTTFEWLNPSLVKGKTINSQVKIDLKKASAWPAPSIHDFGTSRVGYLPSAEIFTVYKTGVTIAEGVTTEIKDADALKLKREVSLMRLRINKKDTTTATNLHELDFEHANNFVAVQKLPVGIGLQLGAFGGGMYSTASDENRTIIGASGTNTYQTANPSAAGYSPNMIVNSDFTLWREVMVFPNCTRADGIAIGADAEAPRRYTVILAAWAPVGYKFADGVTTVTAPGGQPVYWSGTVKGVFSPNVIREVNLRITSGGSPTLPDPEKEGGLLIDVLLPEAWNSNIQSEYLEI